MKTLLCLSLLVIAKNTLAQKVDINQLLQKSLPDLLHIIEQRKALYEKKYHRRKKAMPQPQKQPR